MNFKYTLPDCWIEKISNLEEFANGATQVSIRLKDEREISGVLISNGMHIVAIRGSKDVPFNLGEIQDIFQTADDKNPCERSGWYYWDNWHAL